MRITLFPAIFLALYIHIHIYVLQGVYDRANSESFCHFYEFHKVLGGINYKKMALIAPLKIVIGNI